MIWSSPWSSLLLTFLLLDDTTALWPFPKKRFTANRFITAGPLGLQDAERVVAFGDFDGDQFLDVVTLNRDQTLLTVYVWNHDQFLFQKNVTIQSPDPVVNVVPGDYTWDGQPDLLVMSMPSSSSKALELMLHIGSARTGFESSPVSIPPSTLSQPIPLDFNGDMRIDLLGHIPDDKKNLYVWKNVWEKSNGTILYDTIDANLPGSTCSIVNPHSNAVLDLDGDCLADLFLVCEDPSTKLRSFQVWLNDRATGSFKLKQSASLPRGAGPITFADMDRDGTVDLIFPTCESFSTSTGIGHGCSINIAYNKQKPLCASTSGAGGFGAERNCRSPDALCVADPDFNFNLQSSPEDDTFVSIPLSDIIPNMSSLLLFDVTFTPPVPLGLKPGDADLDGFPDLLAVAVDGHGDVYTPRLLWNIGCSRGVPGCGTEGKGRRGFKVASGNAIELLEGMTDVRGVGWVDLDEDGTLDILVQRTGRQGQGTITFVQNNVFHDAFFLKAIVLNGACNGYCTPKNTSEPSYRPFGVSYPGGTYKYTILDTTGARSAAQVSQLPQTSYHALQTPYSFFGLGRTNNYIENLFVGSTLRHPTQLHYINMEGVIPNSRVVITPGLDQAWRRELYLRPGEWIPWVTVTLVVATTILAVIVGVLKWNEKREDELERRRALHHINFDAL